MKNILEGFVYAALTFFLITAAVALLNSLSDDKGHNRAITALEERVSLLEEASPYVLKGPERFFGRDEASE